jgi:hypothetical protein
VKKFEAEVGKLLSTGLVADIQGGHGDSQHECSEPEVPAPVGHGLGQDFTLLSGGQQVKGSLTEFYN